MRQVTINIYKFDELSKESQERVLEDFRNNPIFDDYETYIEIAENPESYDEYIENNFSDEAIKECIETNDYEFTENGIIYNN